MNIEEIRKIGTGVAGKYRAVYGQRFVQASAHPAHLHALYASQRFSADTDPFVRPLLLSLLMAGPEEEPAFRPNAMGGVAGAYLVARGDSPAGRSETGLIFRHMEDLLGNQPRSAEGLFLCRPDAPVCADLLMEVCPFLAMAAVATREDRGFDEAIRQYVGMEAVLLDKETGLLRHAAGGSGPDGESPCFWVRANGHAAYALVEMLRCLPATHTERPALEGRLQALMEKLLPLQGGDGLWRRNLVNAESDAETSGSAFILYALAAGLTEGWLDLEAGPALDRGWQGLLGVIDHAGGFNISGCCVDTPPGGSLAYYEQRPSLLNDAHAFAPLLLCARAMIEVVRHRTWETPTAPQHTFERPDDAEVIDYVARVHEMREAAYNGDGSWGNGTLDWGDDYFRRIGNRESRTSHPLFRTAGHCVLGYLGAHAMTGLEIYAQRAKEGLDWLVAGQEPDGCFRLYTRRAEGDVNHRGCLFPTGIAAAALIAGYERFRDPRYREASARAAAWEIAWPITRNVNFNAFAIWHLAEHYRHTGDESALQAAVIKAREGMLQWQEPSGGWPGHNSWAWYHGINLRAYASLHAALPQRSGFKEYLGLATRAAVGYLVGLQQEDGSLHANPDTPEPTMSMDFALAGGVQAYATLADPAALDLVQGLVRWRISPESGDPETYVNQEQKTSTRGHSTDVLYGLGAYLGGVAGRDGES